MPLSKTIDLTVDGYNIKLSSPLQFYQNDQLDLIFAINEFGVQVKNSVQVRSLMPITPLKAYLFVESPDGADVVNSASIVENKVVFRLEEEHTQHIGTTRLQIVLLNDKGCRVTLPEFTCEIKENIFGDIKISELLLVNTNREVLLTDEGEMFITGIDFD